MTITFYPFGTFSGGGSGVLNLTGDVIGSGSVPGTITTTVASVGGQTAANIGAAVAEVIASNTNFTIFEVRSNEGIDDPANGSVLKPLQTISYALSLITDSSISKPYLINALGNFNESALNPKPYVFINGNDSIISVSNEINLDASWSAGGIGAIYNFSNVAFNNNMILDFTSLPSSLFIMDNLISTVSPKCYFYGNPSGGTTIILNNITALSDAFKFRINPQDCDFIIKNSKFQDFIYFTTAGASIDFIIDSFENEFTTPMSITNGATNLITFKNFSSSSNTVTLAGGAGSGINYKVSGSLTTISLPIITGNVTIDYFDALPFNSINADTGAVTTSFKVWYIRPQTMIGAYSIPSGVGMGGILLKIKAPPSNLFNAVITPLAGTIEALASLTLVPGQAIELFSNSTTNWSIL